GGGRDLICGGAGSDVLLGGGGADRIVGESGPDVLRGQAGSDRLFGDDGRDVLAGGSGGDRLNGGHGADLATFDDATGPVRVFLSDGRASGEGAERVSGVENVRGSR